MNAFIFSSPSELDADPVAIVYRRDPADARQHKQFEPNRSTGVSWLSRLRSNGGRGDALHVGDARFDDWEVVRDFEDLVTARAWRRHLSQLGVEGVLTADWELDRFGRGDIALRVPPGMWSEAEELLSDLDD